MSSAPTPFPAVVRSPDAPLLLKVPDAARLLGIGRSTLYELLARGELRAVHIGRAVRVQRSEVEAFVGRVSA